MSVRRLKKELLEFENNPHPGFTVKSCEDNIYEWKATMLGPPNSPYENGVFLLKIDFPKEYPFKPPNIIFTTQIYHPNITKTGNICCDCTPLIRDGWSTSTTASKFLNYIYDLLSRPDPNCIFDTSNLYNKDFQRYYEIAKEWTLKFALAENITNSDSSQEITNGNNLQENQNENDLQENQNENDLQENQNENQIRENTVNNDRSIAITNSFTYFFENNMYTDVVLRIHYRNIEITAIECHKLVLALWSPVFEDMFFGENDVDEVIVSDVSPSALEVLINYCYGIKLGEFENYEDIDLLLKIYTAANKYRIQSLIEKATKIIKSIRPTVNNVAELLLAAIEINSTNLILQCHKILQDNTAEVLSMPDATPAVIDTVLGLERLSLESEFELHLLLFEWGNNQLGGSSGSVGTLRNVMETYLPKLSFLSLKLEDFLFLANKYKDFFTDAEVSAFVMNISYRGSKSLPAWYGATEISRSFKVDTSENSLAT